jgi:hypothetical protein
LGFGSTRAGSDGMGEASMKVASFGVMTSSASSDSMATLRRALVCSGWVNGS